MWADADHMIVSSSGSDGERLSELRPASPLRQDPFDNLPSETIVDIFSYACPVVHIPAHMDPPREYASRHPDPEILSAVCKRWQAIALTNPSLWAALIIKSRRIKRNHWVRWGFSQLRSCLERSGAYPLNIRIDGMDHGAGMEGQHLMLFNMVAPDILTLRGILDMIMLHSERWRRVAFDFALEAEFVPMFNTLNDRLPLLEHLEIKLLENRYFGNQFTSTAFASAPKLKSLSIDLPLGLDGLQKIKITWTQITEITFSTSDFGREEDLHENLQCLSGSLTSLIFLGPYTIRFADSDDEFPRKTTLTQLRRLCLLSTCPAILDVLVCPSLKELQIDYGTEREITSFLDRSSCALTSIKLHGLDPPTHHVILQHTSLSTLKYLSLSEITDSDLDILNFNTHHLFPSLETLHLHLSFGRPINHPQALYQIQSVPTSENLCSNHASDRYGGGPKLLAYQIQRLRKVVDSRTRRTTALNQPKSFVDGFQSSEVQWDARSSLKHCLFHFDLQPDGPEVDDYWDNDPIYALRSFCIWRKIFVLVGISYPWDNIPGSLDGGEEGPTTE